MDLTNYMHDATITAMTDDYHFTVNLSPAKADGYFEFGSMYWRSGNNQFNYCEIKGNVGNVLTLKPLPLLDVQVGDTLVMTNVHEFRQGLFPGQFFYSDAFLRSVPMVSAHVVVEAPEALDLRIGTTGTSLTSKVETTDGLRRHTLTLAPQTYRPEEAGAVSPIGRAHISFPVSSLIATSLCGSILRRPAISSPLAGDW